MTAAKGDLKIKEENKEKSWTVLAYIHLQFLSSSFRNSIYKSIISNSLLPDCLHSPRRSPAGLLHWFGNTLIKTARGITSSCDLNGVWMRSEKLLADSPGFLRFDLISGGNSRGTQSKQNLYLEGETAFKSRDASMLRSGCKA